MLFGQIGFHCPIDGQMTVGFECIEDMVMHRRGHADISLRCPKCGTLVEITTHAPIVPRAVVEAISNDLGIPFRDGKITFGDLVESLAGSAHSLEFSFESDEDECHACEHKMLEERSLSDAEEAQLGFFASELDKLDSVSDFFARLDQDCDTD